MKKRSGGQDQGPGRMIGVKLFLEFHAQRVDDTIRVSVVASHLHDGQHILVRKAGGAKAIDVFARHLSWRAGKLRRVAEHGEPPFTEAGRLEILHHLVYPMNIGVITLRAL